MRRSHLLCPLLVALLATPAWAASPSSTPARAPQRNDAIAATQDPDLPGFVDPGTVDKEAYLRARAAHVALMRGLDSPDAAAAREVAVGSMQNAQRALPFVTSGSWSPVGPNPVPNGQTVNVTLPVSGRVTAIAVHPTNENIVYLGTASGGLYRTLDGGTTWTPLMDAAASLSIGAIAIDPLDPTIVFVGTGEGNLSLDSFMGVGLYRIRAADTAPIVEGPFETRVAGTGTTAGSGHAFIGNSIDAIAVDPTNDSRVFIGTTWGFGGASGDYPATVQMTGLYFTDTATWPTPTFSLVSGITGAGYPLVTALAFDPGNPNLLLVADENYYDSSTGIYRSLNAGTASVSGNVSPSFLRTYNPGSAVNLKLAASGTGSGLTVYAGVGTGSGAVIKSTSGGGSWASLAGANGFCSGQCWYDIGIATDPNNANNLFVGGQAGNLTLFRSIDGGATFANFPTGLHADVHALAVAPSNGQVVYEGNDGGIFRSNDGGQSWASLNNTGLNTIQFISGAAHPTDPDFWIGGSQDNGTHWLQPGATWTRADYGDGGFAAIDQNAANNTNVTMYHTYYNTSSGPIGYAHVTTTANAHDGAWAFSGNGSNGIATGESPNFYAPLVLGPGSPNTVYYGTDRLHRSADGGVTNPVVSQAPIVSGVPISAIAIWPNDDHVRYVGLNNGLIFGTSTGSSTLTNLTGSGMPGKYVGRILPLPGVVGMALVAYCGYGLAPGQHIWLGSNLNTASPTWTPMGNGIPDVPVNALAIDPLTPTNLYAGTDVGVYQSLDGGLTWLPFTTGMPTVPVFDLVVQQSSHVLRAATHGRGLWERTLPAYATPTELAATSTEIVDGKVALSWYSDQNTGASVTLYRRPVPGDWSRVAKLAIPGDGVLKYTDATVQPGMSYEYELGLAAAGGERYAGQVWVTVPTTSRSGLQFSANPAHDDLTVAFALAPGAPATVELVDVTGRRVATQSVAGAAAGDASVTLATQAVRPGLYWVRVTQGERSLSRRVSIVH